MASIEKRGDGRWTIRWRDPDGKARARSCSSAEAAKKLRREVEQCVEQGHRWEPRDLRALPALEVVGQAWIRALGRKQLSPKSIGLYASQLDMFLQWLPSTDRRRRTWEVDALQRTNLEAWFDHLTRSPSIRGGRRSPTSCRKYLSTVEQFWAWAFDHDDDWPDLVPRLRRVSVEVQHQTGRQRTSPTWAELALGVGHMAGWHRHVGVVLYYTGLRVQQAMRLRWEDVNLDRSELTIRGELGKTRAEKRGRVIPLSPHFVATLRDWPSGEWVVPKPGTRQAHAHQAALGWKAAEVRRVVWSQDPWHCFRAGWQSNMLRAGAAWLATEFYLGHKLPGTGENYVDPILAFGLTDLVQLIPQLALPDGWAALTETPDRRRKLSTG